MVRVRDRLTGMGGRGLGMVALRGLCVALVATLVVVTAGWPRTLTAVVPATAVGGYGLSVSSVTFVDTTRGTPARIGVSAYPTRTIHELIFDPVGPSGPLPTVIFAPGWDSQSAVYGPLLQAIASAGFLVVGVDSPGSSDYFPGTPYAGPAGEDISNDTIDLSAAVSNLESGPYGWQRRCHRGRRRGPLQRRLRSGQPGPEQRLRIESV